MKFHENSRISRSASKNLPRCEFHFTWGSIFLDDIGEKPSRLSHRMRVHGHRLISSVPMGIFEAISWFLIDRNTIKRFTPIRLPVVVAVQGKDFWRRGRLRRDGYGTANFRRSHG